MPLSPSPTAKDCGSNRSPGASQVAVAVTAETGPVFTPSVAASAATVTTTWAEPAGVTASLYVVSLTAVNVPVPPPVTVTSPAAKPVTSSENVNVAVNGVREVILAGTPVIETVGAVASHSAVALTAKAGPVLPPPSVAASAATVTTTSAEPEGVTASVYVVPLPENAPFVPPVTVTSPVTNPVTASENVNATLSAVVELIFAGTPVIETVGLSPSSSVTVTRTFPLTLV